METAPSSLRGGFLSKLTPTFFLLIIIAAIIVNVLAPIFALRWAAHPFLGALFYPRLVIADIYDTILATPQLGFQSADVLTQIDDTPVSTGREVYIHLLQKQLDKRVTLQLDRTSIAGGRTAESLSLTLNSPFPLQNLLLFFWLPYSIGLVYLAMGFVLYRLRHADQLSRVFLTFCAFVSIFLGALFDQFTLHLLTPLWVLALPLVGAGLLHLSFVFPVETRLARRNPWLPVIPYVIAVLLAIISLFNLYLGTNPRAFLGIWVWGFSFLGFSVILFLALLLNAHTTTFSAMTRQQITIVFGASLISFGPIAVWALVQTAGFNLEFLWFNFTTALAAFIVFPLVIAYAALRYRLLDLDLVFSRAVVYTLLTLLVTVAYFLLVSTLAVLLQDVELFKNPIVFTMFILLLIIVLGPVKERLQRLVKRIFLREPSDFRQLQQRYGQALVAAPLETNLILSLLCKQVEEALAPAKTLVFLREVNLDTYIISDQHGGDDLQHTVEVSFSSNDDLVHWLTSTNDILQLSPTGVVAPEVKINPEELARLNMLNVNLCVPLLGSNHLLGWLALGLKDSGQPYTSSDLLFLATLASETTIALESAQLLEQANQRAAEMEALQKISADIQAEAESDLLLTSVVERATKLLQAEGGLAFLVEADNETLKVVVSYNLAKDFTGYTLAKGEGLAGQVVLKGKTLVVDHYQNFSGRSPKFENAKFGAVLGVPLRWGGKVRGVLHLIHRPRGPRFNERDIWLMELFAAQASIALEKSRLLQEAQHRANQLATLSEVSVAISSTLDLDTALQRVMDCAVQILNAEAGSLLLMDPRGKELTFEVVLGPTGANLRGLKTEVGKGIVGTVAKTGQPLIINDAAADPRWNVAFDEATNFRTKDILCVPMLSHERVVGVVEVINKQDGTVFTQEECNLLMSFGAQAAIAIENAQVFGRVDRALAERIQELQALQAIDRELQSSLELKNVLDISLTRAMDALGVEMGLMGVIRTQDEESGLYLLAQRGMPMEMGRYKRDPWPLTKGIMGRVVRTGELAWVNDITQEKDYVPNSHRTRSVLAVPVIREDRVIGIINLESTTPDYFTSDDVSFIKLLVGPAAVAIQNAQLFEQVKEANQAKTEFMNIASHELKIPMTSIKGFSKLLQMGAGGSLTEKQNEFLGVISNNVDRMARLVNDLLDVSRIEAGRIRLEIENVQMRDVINDVLESVQTQIQNKRLDLKVNVSDNLPELRADYSRMVQIMTNFVSNAYKYTPEGGSIMVNAVPCNNGSLQGVTITIKDTGYGISVEDQAKLFTKFFRSSDQNIRDEPGTGLGLSITKSMIEAHGGELTFESELGKGTSFTFTMPLVSKIPPGVEVIER
ncbi:MAG: GAF domain-containing protein [Anaerolineales bacterium]|nr:GAF domain-containing protein [Anaerolineales bacterium]